jgi:hypothetical protein
MTGSLEGPKRKFERADEHIRVLEDEMALWLAEEADRIEEEFDPQIGERRYWLDPRPCPPKWSLIIGDALYNLRSCLDHMVWQLVLANGGQPGRHTSFPIVATAHRFHHVGRSALAGVSDEACELVEAAQPYHPPDLRETETLWHLHELHNEDQHRHLGVYAVGQSALSHPEELDIARIHFGILDGRTELLAVRVAGPRVRLKPQHFLDVAFARRDRHGHPLEVWRLLVDAGMEITALALKFAEGGHLAPPREGWSQPVLQRNPEHWPPHWRDNPPAR